MAYDVTTITLKGADLLASASAADDLILVGCDATQQFINKASAIQVENRPANPFSTTSNVRLSGSTDNHLFVRAFFVAGESTGGAANSLYIYGHKASDPLNDYVIAIMSSVNPFHLPEVGDISNTYGVLLDIIYNPADGSVSQVTSSVYATYGEYADLRDRAVTTHKQGQATVGDDQTIYGQKTFKSQIISDTGSFGIVDKRVGQNFETYYGDFMGDIYPVGPDNVTYAHTGMTFIVGDDKHVLRVTPSSLTGGGVSRKFGISSETTFNGNQEKLSEVSTFLNKRVVQQSGSLDIYETGRVLIQTTEPKDYQSATIELITGYDENDNGEGNINITTTNFSLQADDMTGNNKGKISLYAAGEISINSPQTTIVGATGILTPTSSYTRMIMTHDAWNLDVVNSGKYAGLSGTLDDQNRLWLTPMTDLPSHEFNLGSPASRFTNIYSDNFHGNLDGDATSATNDSLGVPITNYFKGISAQEMSPFITFFKGDSTTVNASLENPISMVLRGLLSTSGTPYTTVGSIGLFYYGDNTGTFPLQKLPGETISGSSLRPACMARDESTGDVTMPAALSGSLSITGTWALLSFLYKVDANHSPLVLAIKISTL